MCRVRYLGIADPGRDVRQIVLDLVIGGEGEPPPHIRTVDITLVVVDGFRGWGG